MAQYDSVDDATTALEQSAIDPALDAAITSLLGKLDDGTEESVDVSIGGDDADTISGPVDVASIIAAGGGDDSVSTSSGDDIVSGGAGNDSVNTGAGSDSVSVGQGADSVDAGSGWDVVNVSLDSDETSFDIVDGQVVITNIESGEVTTIDNAEYVEFADGTGHLVAGDNNDEALDVALGQAIEAGLISSSGLGITDEELASEISEYLASDEFTAGSESLDDPTDLYNLLELVYENVNNCVIDTDEEEEDFSNWLDAAQDILSGEADDAGVLDALDDIGEV